MLFSSRISNHMILEKKIEKAHKEEFLKLQKELITHASARALSQNELILLIQALEKKYEKKESLSKELVQKLSGIVRVEKLDLKGVLRLLVSLKHSAHLNPELLSQCLAHLDQLLKDEDRADSLDGRMIKQLKAVTRYYGWSGILKLRYFEAVRRKVVSDRNNNLAYLHSSLLLFLQKPTVLSRDAQSDLKIGSILKELLQLYLENIEQFEPGLVSVLYLRFLKYKNEEPSFDQILEQAKIASEKQSIKHLHLLTSKTSANLEAAQINHLKRDLQLWRALIKAYCHSRNPSERYTLQEEANLILEISKFMSACITRRQEVQAILGLQFSEIKKALLLRLLAHESTLDNQRFTLTLNNLNEIGGIDEAVHSQINSNLLRRMSSFTNQDLMVVNSFFYSLWDISGFLSSIRSFFKIIDSKNLIANIQLSHFEKLFATLNSLNNQEFAGLRSKAIFIFCGRHQSLTNPACFVKIVNRISQHRFVSDKLWVSIENKIFTNMKRFTLEEKSELLLAIGQANRGSYYLWTSLTMSLMNHLDVPEIYGNVIAAFSANHYRYLKIVPDLLRNNKQKQEKVERKVEEKPKKKGFFKNF